MHLLPICGRGFKRGLPLSLEFQKPGGFWCALCETFFTQESFRGCGSRRPAIVLIKGSEKKPCSFSCPHHRKCGFTECPSADLGRDRLCREVPAEPICGAARSTPRLLSFHEESNQRRAKEEVSSLDSPPRGRPHLCFLRCPAFLCAVPRMGKAHSPNFSAEKLLPSGTSQSEVLSPRLLRQRDVVRPLPCHFGQQVVTSSAASTDAEGFQKGSCMTPFAGGQGTRWFLVCSL